MSFAAFLYISLCWKFYWQKEIGKKAASKMLVKLTPGVNIIIILLAPFLYKSALCSFFLITVCV